LKAGQTKNYQHENQDLKTAKIKNPFTFIDIAALDPNNAEHV